MSEHTMPPIERAIATGDREFRELADFAPVMIWRVGPDRQCDWVNKPWLEFTGRTMADEVAGGWEECVHPDDLERAATIFNDAYNERTPFSMEYRLRRHDGEYRWVQDNGAPYHRHGEFVGFWGSCMDITIHREAQRAQRVLINELNHRVKNTLAVVQAMAMQSFSPDRPVQESMDVFESRLRALSGAHDLLVARSWEDVALRGLVESTIAPHDPGGDRIVIDGPALTLGPQTAMSVAMAIHELLTNAAKYGALSTEGGGVVLSWSFDDASNDGRLRLEWKENGGPAVHSPERRGFGTRFIERVLAGEVGGKAEILFETDGVRCVFEAPGRTRSRHHSEELAARSQGRRVGH